MINLYDDQQQILDTLVPYILKHMGNSNSHPKEKIAQIIGFAGTGKTVLTGAIVDEIAKHNKKVKITAPTHKAVQVIKNNTPSESVSDFSTIHSHLKLKVKKDFNTGKEVLFPDFKNDNGKNYYDLLIVDESSMVGEELYKFILNALDQKNVGFVLFTGDACQLPPVNESFTVEKALPEKQTYRLTEIKRQAKDSPIIKMAEVCVNHIKNKKNSNFDDFIKELLNPIKNNIEKEIKIVNDYEKFIMNFINTPIDEYNIALSYTNKNVDKINDITRFQKRHEDLEAMGGYFPFIEDDILIMQDRFQSNGEVYLNNEEVIVNSATLEYDGDFKYWNISIKDRRNPIKVLHDDSKPDYDKKLKLLSTSAKIEKDMDTRTRLWKGFFMLKEKFANVKYHYASTIHKSQGSTVDSAYIDLKSLRNVDVDLRNRLIYVALTRARNSVTLYL